MVDSLDVRVRLLEARTAQMEAAKTSRAIRGIGHSAKQSGKEQKEASGSLLGSMKGVATLAAGAGIYEFFKSGVTGALNLQQSITTVNNSLAQVGIHSKSVTNQLKEQAEAASQAGGGSTEEELQGIAQFVQQTRSLTAAQKANSAANKLARGSGMSYAAAQQLIAGAEAGRTRGLNRYLGVITPVKTAEQALTDAHKAQVIQIDGEAKAMGKAGPAWKARELAAIGITKASEAQAATQDKQATAQAVISRVTTRYGHAQESMKQKIEDARHAFENLATNLATALLPTITKLIKVGANFAAFLSKHKGLAEALAIAIGTLATSVLAGKLVRAIGEVKKTFGGAVTAIKGGFGAIKTAAATTFEFIMANPWVLAIAAAIAVIVLIITHFKEFKRIVGAVFNFVKTIVGDVITFIKGHWALILSILTGPIGAAVIFIATHFTKVKHAVTDVLHFIEHIAGDVLHWLEWPFIQAWKFISGLPGKIANTFKGIAHHIPILGHFLHTGGVVHAATGGAIYRAFGGPSGTDTVPAMLSPGEYVLNRSVVNQIGLGNLQSASSGIGAGVGQGSEQFTIQSAPVNLYLDGRIIAQAVLKQALNKAARGTSSLSGGALANTGGYTSFATGAPA